MRIFLNTPGGEVGFLAERIAFSKIIWKTTLIYFIKIIREAILLNSGGRSNEELGISRRIYNFYPCYFCNEIIWKDSLHCKKAKNKTKEFFPGNGIYKRPPESF